MEILNVCWLNEFVPGSRLLIDLEPIINWLIFLCFQLNNMDPNDLLSFLDGPGDLATPPSSGAGSENGNKQSSSQDDLLSLFD